ncbi:hypothetical protein HDU77_008731 [Chytriomyces hyalinus]|nr:hypothetical protein HDU77_008731 [Chytriomyces hyalinus]
MRSAEGKKTLSHAAPRRSERLQQRRLAKELQISESTTVVAGSKRSHVDEDTGVRFTLKRIRLIVKEEAPVEATVETPDVVLEETDVLPIPMDTAESENFSADVMGMDPHPLPVFSQLVYRPSQLSMSVAMDVILIPSCTSSPGRNSSRTAEAIWAERGAEDPGLANRGGAGYTGGRGGSVKGLFICGYGRGLEE